MSTSRKHTTGSMGNFIVLSCRWSKITAVRCGCWTPTRVCAVTTSLHRLYEFDRQVTAESTRVSLLVAEGSTDCILQTIWCCLHPLNRVFKMYLDGFSFPCGKLSHPAGIKSEYNLSRNTSQCALTIHCSRLIHSSTLGWYSRVAEGKTRLKHGLAKQTVSLCGDKTGAFRLSILRRDRDVTLREKVRNCDIRKVLNVEPLLRIVSTFNYDVSAM